MEGARLVEGVIKLNHHRGGISLFMLGIHFLATGQVFLVGSANGNDISLAQVPEMVLDQESWQMAKNVCQSVVNDNLQYWEMRVKHDPLGEEDGK